jgi:RNA polymerase sigma-70 factor (ECF subfamily)
VPHSQTPDLALEQKERIHILKKAIDKLPPNQKSAFTLHKYEDLSYQEIAEVLNTSLSSVESLMHRAKQNLKKLLKNYYENKL